MSEPEVSRPGSILRAEREALGVTVREVSETLNLSMSAIEAIEADDYERLPGPVFARGYVRAYARLLELEPDPLLAQIPRPPDPMDAVPERPELPVWEWIRRRPGLVLGGAAGLLVAVVVMMAVWLWPGGESQDASAGTAPGAVPHTAAPSGAPPAAGLAARTPTSPQSRPDASAAGPLTDGAAAAAAPVPDAPATPSPGEAAAPAAGVVAAARRPANRARSAASPSRGTTVCPSRSRTTAGWKSGTARAPTSTVTSAGAAHIWNWWAMARSAFCWAMRRALASASTAPASPWLLTPETTSPPWFWGNDHDSVDPRHA